jgi:predicted DNA-binding transcriptional regulator YafY
VRLDASPTARALLALDLLQAAPGTTAQALADELGVSERAARRYVGVLREADIPIESVRGPYGGYRVGRGLRLPPLVFSASEALGLVMAVLDGHHDAGDPADPVGSALGKLMRALPERVAAQAETVRRATAPAPDRAAARPDPATTTAVVQACSERRLVRLGYRSEAGSEWEADVEPWAVVVRHGRWYLLCWSRAAAARRAYRIDRMRDVVVLDGTFDPPADLDAVAVLEEHLAVGWEFDVDVLIDAPRDVVARCLPRALGVLDAVDDETSRLTGTTGNPVWYAEQLVAIPAAYRIVGGPEVRASARELGLRLLTAGGGRPPVGAVDAVPADRPHPDGGPMEDTHALPWIGRPAAGALAAAGISTLREVTERSERELLALHGVGPKAIRLLRAALAERGLALRGDA